MVGNNSKILMKNTARHIFQTNRMDLSDMALKRAEAEVLSMARAEVIDLGVRV